MHMHLAPKFGFDIGGPIINRKFPGAEFTGPNYLKAPINPEAIKYLERLAILFGPESIYLISKVRKEFQQKTDEVLKKRGFLSRTGIPEDNVLYCPERWDKLVYCTRKEIDYFMDDRMETHSYLHPHVKHLYYYQPVGAPPDKITKEVPVTLVRSWEETYAAIQFDAGLRNPLRITAGASANA